MWSQHDLKLRALAACWEAVALELLAPTSKDSLKFRSPSLFSSFRPSVRRFFLSIHPLHLEQPASSVFWQDPEKMVRFSLQYLTAWPKTGPNLNSLDPQQQFTMCDGYSYRTRENGRQYALQIEQSQI